MKFTTSIFILISLIGCTSENGDVNSVIDYKYSETGVLLKKTISDTLNNSKIFESYYKEGNIKERHKVVNGLLEGECIRYYPNGNIRDQVYFKNGKLHNRSTFYYNNGNIKETSVFKNGKTIGDTFYYLENGSLKKYGYYVEDKPCFQKTYDYNDKNEVINTNFRYDLNVKIKDTLKTEEEILISTELFKIDSTSNQEFTAYIDYIDSYSFEAIDALPFPKLKKITFDIDNSKSFFTLEIQKYGKYFIYGFLKQKNKSTGEENITEFIDSIYIEAPSLSED